MCGIVGIVSREEIDPNLMDKMIRSLHHRGPDSTGKFFSDDYKVALGHTRLSIIDLSVKANQPMHSPDKRYTIIFNGEIYNFRNIKNELLKINPSIRFATNSDTEVLLHAFMCWGKEMIKKIEGMFAVAIYDSALKKIFLFRDRKGKKPLFYYWDHQQFVFASEMKTLLIHPHIRPTKEIDQQALHEFLHLGYIPEPKTIYRSIRKFPSGAMGELKSNLSLSINQYWNVDDCVREKVNSTGKFDYKDELRMKLTQAVEKRMISDVPLGSFLSGGTDSSLVTAIASKLSDARLKTFSIGFKESKFDEHQSAAAVAKHLNTEHYQYILSERDSVSLLDTYLDHFDEPFADTSSIPTMLVAKMAKQKVTVALTGDGGDELFLGYGTYTWANRLHNPFFKVMKSGLAASLGWSGDVRYKRVSRLLERVDKPYIRSHIFSQEQYFFSSEEIKCKLLKNPIPFEPFRYADNIGTQHLSEAEKQALFDLKFYLKDDLLVKIDRASMFSSLECRCPLLDDELMEWALNIPYPLKKKGNINKWILKDLLTDHLPDHLVYKSKWGFSIPLAQWMKNELNYLMELLSSEKIIRTGIFNVDFVRNLVTRFYQGEEYLYNRLWSLIIIQRFLLKNA